MINNIGIRQSISNYKAIVVIKIDPTCNYSPVHTSGFWSFIRIGFDGLHFFHCDSIPDDILRDVDLIPMRNPHMSDSRTVRIYGVDEI
jgi:hypothetical protein